MTYTPNRNAALEFGRSLQILTNDKIFMRVNYHGDILLQRNGSASSLCLLIPLKINSFKNKWNDHILYFAKEIIDKIPDIKIFCYQNNGETIVKEYKFLRTCSYFIHLNNNKSNRISVEGMGLLTTSYAFQNELNPILEKHNLKCGGDAGELGANLIKALEKCILFTPSGFSIGVFNSETDREKVEEIVDFICDLDDKFKDVEYLVDKNRMFTNSFLYEEWLEKQLRNDNI